MKTICYNIDDFFAKELKKDLAKEIKEITKPWYIKFLEKFVKEQK